MSAKKLASLFLLFLAGAITLATILLQQRLYINHDSGFLLFVAQRVFAGELLYTEIVETNPPLIVFLHILPVACSDLFGGSAMLWLRLLVYLSIGLSIMMCLRVLRKWEVPCGFSMLFLVIGFIFVPFGTYSFGQKEHILVVLVLPYLLLSIGDSATESRSFRLAAGLFAAPGFLLKPHFLLILLGGEVLRGVRRGVGSIVRLELVTLVGAAVAYAVFPLSIWQRYIEHIVPFMIEGYAGLNFPLVEVVSTPVVLLICILAPLTFFRPEKENQRPLLMLFFLVFLAACAGAILQMKGWEYHFLPARVFAIYFCLTLCIAAFRKFQKGGSRKKTQLALIVLVVSLGAQLTVPLKRYQYWPAVGEQGISEKFVATMEKFAPGGNVAGLSFSLYPNFPAVNYASSDWSLRVSSFLLLPGVYWPLLEKEENIYRPYESMHTIERQLLHQTVEDFKRRPPDLLIVDRSNIASLFGIEEFDFLRFLSAHPYLAKMLKEFEQQERIRSAELDSGGYDVYVRRQPAGNSP